MGWRRRLKVSLLNCSIDESLVLVMRPYTARIKFRDQVTISGCPRPRGIGPDLASFAVGRRAI